MKTKNCLSISFLAACCFVVSMLHAQSNAWSGKAAYAGTARSKAAGFMINNTAYIGTGYGLVNYFSDFWKWNPATNTWTQVASFPGGQRESTVSFAIGNKGYVGLGADGPGWAYNHNDMYEYDPVQNTWTAKANYAGGAIRDAAAFVIGNKAYVGTGLNSSSNRVNDFYEFDPVANSWSQRMSFAGTARHSATAFSINGMGYLGTGDDGNVTQDFWEYNPVSDNWTQKASLPGAGRVHAASFAIGAYGFVVAGSALSNWQCYQDLWQYDQALNAWQQKTNYLTACYAPVAFANASKGYCGTGGNGSSSFYTDFSEYAPSVGVNVPEVLHDIPFSFSVSASTLQIVFNTSEPFAADVELFDLTGKRVWFCQKTAEEQTKHISLEGPGESVYLVRVTDTQRQMTKTLKLNLANPQY